MTNVAQIGLNAASVGMNFSRAGFFDTAVTKQNINRQSKWEGGAKQQNASTDSPATSSGKKADEKAMQAGTGGQKKPDSYKKFFGNNSSYFPAVDYYANQREAALFESIKGKAGISSNWKQALTA